MYKSYKLIIAILVFAAYSKQSQAQGKEGKIDSLLSLYHSYEQLNGSVLIAENGKVIYKKSFGYADIGWEIPNTTDTKFRVASMTKQFTAMLIMQLAEQGKLKVSDKIVDHIPEYPNKSGEKITIHHLLTHTSGIPNYTAIPKFRDRKQAQSYKPSEFIKEFWDMVLDFEPGSQFRYSNSGYFLLGVIIENLTGGSFQRALQEKILDPLQMTNTGMAADNVILKKNAAGYFNTYDGYTNGAPNWNVSVAYSAGGMYTTVEDLYLWDQALYEKNLLSEQYSKMMYTPNLKNYAYGWWVFGQPLTSEGDTVNCIEHSGFHRDYSSIITRVPDKHHLIVILNNYRLNEVFDIKKGILKILYEHELDQSDMPVKSISSTIYKTISNQGMEAALNQYHSLKKDSSDYYNFSSRELNLLGYFLLRKGNKEAAINIFKLYVETYPESFNAYDSLGEAYMKNGDNELAIINYNKSLELSPENKNAIEMLKKLTNE